MKSCVQSFKCKCDSALLRREIFFLNSSQTSLRSCFLILLRSGCRGESGFLKLLRTDDLRSRYFEISLFIILNSSSVTLLSSKAFETRPEIESRFATASVWIFSCFDILDSSFLVAAVIPAVFRVKPHGSWISTVPLHPPDAPLISSKCLQEFCSCSSPPEFFCHDEFPRYCSLYNRLNRLVSNYATNCKLSKREGSQSVVSGWGSQSKQCIGSNARQLKAQPFCNNKNYYSSQSEVYNSVPQAGSHESNSRVAFTVIFIYLIIIVCLWSWGMTWCHTAHSWPNGLRR